MTTKLVETPILVTAFNRPNYVSKVLSAIPKSYKGKIFISIDGPRVNSSSDLLFQSQTIDVCERFKRERNNCEIWVSEKNLGPRWAMKTAITNFYSLVFDGIVLEDDCVPAHNFFIFVNEMLQRHRHDSRVMQISGSHLLRESPSVPYYFSKINDVWGWATWRDRWIECENITLPSESDLKNQVLDYFQDRLMAEWFMSYCLPMYSNESQIWSIDWTLAILFQKGLTVNSGTNLISNIGFGLQGTNSHDSFKLNQRDVSEIPLNLVELPVIWDQARDFERFKLIMQSDPFFYTSRKKFFNRIKVRISRLQSILSRSQSLWTKH